MAKKEKPKPDDKEQSQRFLEAARSLEADESGRKFNEAVEKIATKQEKPPSTRGGAKGSR